MLSRVRIAAAGALCVAALTVAACGGPSGALGSTSVTSSTADATPPAVPAPTGATTTESSPAVPTTTVPSSAASLTVGPSVSGSESGTVVTGSPTVPTSSATAPVTSAPAAVTPPQTGTSASAVTPPRNPSPTLAVSDADRARAARIVASMSLTDRAASVLMVTGSDAIGTGLLVRQHVGGVILFAPGGVVNGTSNGTPAQVAAVTARLRADAAKDPAGVPPLIGTDQEFGLVQRLKHGFTTFPRAAELGSIGDLDKAATVTRRVAVAAAQEMRAVGVTVDFAPVFGVLPDDGGPSAIGQYGRSYGSDPQRVARLVAAAVTGYQHGGVVAGMKHFPGLARIAADSHVTLPELRVSCADWNAHEAIPAKAGIEAGALMVMTGHMLLPAAGDATLPASLSPVIVQQLLKGDGAAGCVGMGFDGVAVTDSMEMAPVTGRFSSAAAAVQALAAGEDLILMPANPAKAIAGIVAAVERGTLPAARLDDAATAVIALRIACARVPSPPLSVVNSAAHRALAAEAFAAAG